MESFFEYEEPQQSVQDVWDDPETIFIVDTNIFLNIYVFHQETRQVIYDALDKIKERLWSPHQVMLEFHKNRVGKIQESKKRLDTIENHINKFIKQYKFKDNELTTCDNQYGKWYPSIREQLTTFQKNAQVVIKNKLKELEKILEVEAEMLREKLDGWKTQIIPSVTKDSIYQKLCELYSNDKIGKPFTRSELDELYKEGELRLRHGVPPGYKDKGKDEIYHHRGIIYHSKFGDLILYKQILEYCKTHKIKNVIFISEDNAKGDWAYKDTKALRKEIRGEAFEVAGIQNFIIMNKDSLLEYSGIEKSRQVKEDFERADNLLKMQGGEEIDLSNIGLTIYQTWMDARKTTDEKLSIFNSMTGHAFRKRDFSDYYYLKQELTNVYKCVMGLYFRKYFESKVKLIRIEKEIIRVIEDKRLPFTERSEIILFIRKQLYKTQCPHGVCLLEYVRNIVERDDISIENKIEYLMLIINHSIVNSDNNKKNAMEIKGALLSGDAQLVYRVLYAINPFDELCILERLIE